MTCQFDDAERELLDAWWRLGCLGGQDLAGLAPLNPGETGETYNTVSASTLTPYGECVYNQVRHGPSEFAQLRLELHVEHPDVIAPHHPNTSLIGWWTADLGLDFQTSRLFRRTTKTTAASRNHPLSRVLVNHLDERSKLTLARYLHTGEGDFPDIPRSVFAQLPHGFDEAIARIDQNTINTLNSQTIRAAWVTLIRSCNTDDNHDLSLADVIRHVIDRSLVTVPSSPVATVDRMDSLWTSPATNLLNQGHLAAYLARLKNGSTAERERFKQLQREFKRLSGTPFDVQLRSVAGSGPNAFLLRQTFRPIKANVPRPDWEMHEVREGDVTTAMVTSTWDLPLNQAGSGKVQLLQWLAALQVPAASVVLADEPDMHFHPTLAARTAAALRAAQAQVILVSHSPYSIPSGALTAVRHITHKNGSSHASAPFTKADATRYALTKKGLNPDDRLFLYAKVVVFVEGAHDAEVFRVWIDRWMHHRDPDREEWGIYIHPCVGKTQVSPLLALARRLNISSLGLWDADVLARKSAEGNDASNNKTIVSQWKDLGLTTQPVKLDDTDTPSLLNADDLFFVGTHLTDNFEDLFDQAYPGWESQMKEQGYFGPGAYRRWAEQHEWPRSWEEFLKPLFDRVAELAIDPPSHARRIHARIGIKSGQVHWGMRCHSGNSNGTVLDANDADRE